MIFGLIASSYLFNYHRARIILLRIVMAHCFHTLQTIQLDAGMLIVVESSWVSLLSYSLTMLELGLFLRSFGKPFIIHPLTDQRRITPLLLAVTFMTRTPLLPSVMKHKVSFTFTNLTDGLLQSSSTDVPHAGLASATTVRSLDRPWSFPSSTIAHG